jgi:regulator of protease activity HflC (stomatin/prohibitin superfamily)
MIHMDSPVSFLGRLKAFLPKRRPWDADDGYPFLGNPLVRIVISVSVTAILLSVAAAHFFIVRSGSDTIVLHYNSYFGVDIVGVPGQSFFLPVVAAVFLLANVILAARFYAGRERIAAHMLLFAALFVSVSSGIAVATLSFINT